MPTKKSAAAPTAEIYQLKVTLLGTEPPIWREFLAPAELTLARLHDVLQITMGWENTHLYEFSVGRKRFGEPDPIGDFFGAPSVASDRTTLLSDVLTRVRSKIDYTYDFGDTWEHSIVLEKRIPVDPNATYPICIAGELACPPEDCGGIFRFYDLMHAFADPDDEEHEEMIEAFGDFDPQSFSIDEVNKTLARLSKYWRKTSRG